MAHDRPQDQSTLQPWDRELVLDARSRRKRSAKGSGSVQPAHRRVPSKVFLLAPWAGIIAFACAIFGSLGPWILDYDWSSVIFGADVAAVVLGIYAVLGAWRGRGRADIAGGALLLGVVGIALWFWVGRPAPLLAPT
jgi:hypothetical protein